MDRQDSNGKWEHQAEVAGEIKEAIYRGLDKAGKDEIPHFLTEAMDMIAVKLSRAVVGDHNNWDHMVDIAGFALCAAGTLNPHIVRRFAREWAEVAERWIEDEGTAIKVEAVMGRQANTDRNLREAAEGM